jgi:ribosomal-protein-alanine N-acetyltransferase
MVQIGLYAPSKRLLVMYGNISDGASRYSLAQRSIFVTIDAAFSNFPSLTTNRLHLRQIELEDAEALFAILSDPQVTEYYGHEPHRSLEETRMLIGQIQTRYEHKEAIRWGITLKRENRLIGTCSLHQFGPAFHYSATGYDLDRAYWGKGIMTEAMTALLTYAFTEVGLHRVEAIIDIHNDRSKNLLLKLGFTYEGNLRQRYFFRDGFEDEHYFGLINREWRGSVSV